MTITLITVGRLKEKYLADAVKEYSKRLGAFCRLEIFEVEDEKTPDKASASEEEKIKEKEGRGILKNIKDQGLVCALAINGTSFSSEEFASFIDKTGIDGISRIYFIIGGSLGLSEEVLKRADVKLSFSKMTFPHQLMRVILLEQIYRAYKIISGQPYHK